MIVLPVLAIAVSGLSIGVLCVGDPKRRRVGSGRGDGQGKSVRRIAVALACLPGMILAATGDVSGFLGWVGGCSLIGWGITLAISKFSAGRP
ncbi:hypothetical protein [Sphingomonas sp.]|uniref:hypothetical protein n=1 Tax=Sphingomonas sp. TaxID=28214 RepID=UPI0025D06A82|nr:hypothetical protein [Sphingomonas sp.]